MKIILGFKSWARNKILKDAGYKFETMVADINEKAIRDDDPKKLVLKLAQAKRDALLSKIKEAAILITADQVVMCNGELREKPDSAKQAREWLKSYNEYPTECINGVTVTNTKTGKKAEAVDSSKIYFKAIPDEVIDDFIASRVPFECAGAFRILDPHYENYIDRIEGTDDSIMGLTLKIIEKLIKQIQ